jgi:hypothetical protein
MIGIPLVFFGLICLGIVIKVILEIGKIIDWPTVMALSLSVGFVILLIKTLLSFLQK